MSGDCKKFRRMIDRYADLNDKEMQILETHTFECSECADELAFLKSIMDSAHSLPEIDVPTDFLDSLNERLDKELQQPKPVPVYKKAVPYVQRYGALAACLAVGIAIGANSDTLMGKLNSDTSDIIESTQSSDAPLLPTADIEELTPAIQQESLTEALPSVPTALTAAPVPATAAKNETVTAPTTKSAGASASTPKTTAANTANVPKATAAPKAALTTPSKQAAVPTQVPKPSNETPKSAQAPQQAPTVTANETATVSEAVAAPAAVNAPSTAAVNEAEPTNEMPSGEVYAAASRAAEPAPRGIDVYSYIAPSDPAYYAAAVPEQTPETENNSSGYEIKEQKSSSFAYNSPFVSSITISEKDAARVKELVDVFVEGSYGGLYMITSQDLEILLRQMDKEGIHYTDALSEQGDNITFKLVIT